MVLETNLFYGAWGLELSTTVMVGLTRDARGSVRGHGAARPEVVACWGAVEGVLSQTLSW